MVASYAGRYNDEKWNYEHIKSWILQLDRVLVRAVATAMGAAGLQWSSRLSEDVRLRTLKTRL